MFLSLDFIKTETSGPILLIAEGAGKDHISQVNGICQKLEQEFGLVVKRVQSIPELSRTNEQKHLVVLDNDAWRSSLKILSNSIDSHSSPYIILHLNVMKKLLQTNPQKWSWNGCALKNLELGAKQCYIFETGQFDRRLDDDMVKLMSVTKREEYNKRAQIQMNWKERIDKVKKNIKYSNGILLPAESHYLANVELVIMPFAPVLMLNAASQSNMETQQELLRILAKRTNVLVKGEEWITKSLLKEEFEEGELLTSWPAKPLAGLIFKLPHLKMDPTLMRALGQLGGRISITNVASALRILPPNFKTFEEADEFTSAEIYCLRTQNTNCLTSEWLSKCLKEKRIATPIFVQPPFLPPFMERLNLVNYRIAILLKCPNDKIRAERIVSKLGATILSSNTDPATADTIITDEIIEDGVCTWELRARTFSCLNDYFNSNTPHSRSCPSSHFPDRVPTKKTDVEGDDEQIMIQDDDESSSKNDAVDENNMEVELIDKVWGEREDSLNFDFEIE